MPVLGPEADLQLSDEQQQTVKLLKTIPGVSPITTVTILAEIGDIQRFSFTEVSLSLGWSDTQSSQERPGCAPCAHHQTRPVLLESGHDPLRHGFQSGLQTLVSRPREVAASFW
jgi:hypothetical protein